MKATILLVTASLSQALAQVSSHPFPWSAPGPDDVRGPCPMLNTLANHGFLPHDGKDITEDRIVAVLNNSLNIAEDLSQFLFKEALTTNPDPNATTFSLSDLSRHNILEHDASLSRQDFYFGDNHDFNQTVFDETRSYWIAPLIDFNAAAHARLARVNTSMATNPTYTESETGHAFSYGESAAYMIVFAEGSETANRSWVEYFFEHERLPQQLGWTKPQESISTSVLIDTVTGIVNASDASVLEVAELIDFVDLHVGPMP
ncbi:Cloroperoxidase [Aspergillus sclerotioniger CBS 115572]|uniref:Cloroperoxidase n=1 Tax=Aspergillus sclerotioniger CBS 115572 TaxID=1450535 RepID=A0A317WY58_9EURO|nr:Cloroperoxidase [Aspergillus sclerotioniger CBS 115572]PWY91289.1 Cloroperoxidase [Aspergillus sclerotioniger CBS 115572]